MRHAVVVKLGSPTPVDPPRRPPRGAAAPAGGRAPPGGALLAALGEQLAAVRGEGVPVCVVSSGAIALGAAALGRSRPADVPGLQAASAVGQGLLLGAWQRALRSAGPP